MDNPIKVSAVSPDGVEETFYRPTFFEASSLAEQLEKEGRTIHIDGELFLNSSGPDSTYLHKLTAECPMCKMHEKCDACGEGAADFYSVRPTHYHQKKVEGVEGWEGIHDILCYPCHRKDRFAVYGEGYGEATAAA